MDPVVKKSKKKARKAGGEAKPAVQTEVNPPTAGEYTSSRDEEELADYEPEEPARFFLLWKKIYLSMEMIYRPHHGDGPADNSTLTNDLPCVLQALIHACSTPRSIDIHNT
jgi:hypothetical protein